MTIIHRRLVLAGGLVFSAAAALGSSAALAQSGDVQAVDKAVADLRDAMLAADGAKLATLLSDQLSYGHSAGRLETKAQFLDIVAGKKTLYKSIAFSDATTSVAGNNAIVRHVMTVDVETDGKPATAKVGALQVHRRGYDQARALARHRGTLEHLFVGGVFPLDQVLNDPEEALALFLLGFLGRKEVGVRRGILDHLGKDHGPSCGEGPPGPPEVQGAGMPVPDRFLLGRRLIDGLERECDLDQLLVLLHSCIPKPWARRRSSGQATTRPL